MLYVGRLRVAPLGNNYDRYKEGNRWAIEFTVGADSSNWLTYTSYVTKKEAEVRLATILLGADPEVSTKP